MDQVLQFSSVALAALAAVAMVVVALFAMLVMHKNTAVRTEVKTELTAEPISRCTKPCDLRLAGSELTDDGASFSAECRTCGRKFQIKS